MFHHNHVTVVTLMSHESLILNKRETKIKMKKGNKIESIVYNSNTTGNIVNLSTSNKSTQIASYSIQNPILMIYIYYLSDLYLLACTVADF